MSNRVASPTNPAALAAAQASHSPVINSKNTSAVMNQHLHHHSQANGAPLNTAAAAAASSSSNSIPQLLAYITKLARKLVKVHLELYLKVQTL